MILRIIHINIYKSINKQSLSLEVNNDETFQVSSFDKNVNNLKVSLFLFPSVFHVSPPSPPGAQFSLTMKK